MFKKSLDEIASALGCLYLGKDGVYPKNLSIDSRAISKDDIFLAVKGEKVDGHIYVDKAFQKGASASVVEDLSLAKEKEDKGNFIVTDHSIDFLQKLASYNLSFFEGQRIAITGSTGKTSTKDILAQILSKKLKVTKSEGNNNNEIGLPLTLCKLNEEQEVLITEMGMRGLGQIDFLCKMAEPKIGIITNIGKTHAEILGSQENIAKAKAELIENIDSENGILFLNEKDQVFLRDYVEKSRAKIFWFGSSKDSAIRLKEIIEIGNDFSRFIVSVFGEEIEINLNLAGKHNIYNSLAAIGLARHLNIETELIKEALKNIQLSANRLEIIEKRSRTFINDAYNANLDSMLSSIDVLSSYSGRRKIAVVGDMLELGRYERESHLKVGSFLKEKNIDLIITVGNLGKIIAEGAIASGFSEENIKSANDIKEAVDYLQKMTSSQDIILLKASRGLELEKIIDIF